MVDMTDYQLQVIIKSIIQIIKDNDDKQVMIEKIEAIAKK